MIANISPASILFEESRNTLLYADRAKNIRMKVKKQKHSYLHFEFVLTRTKLQGSAYCPVLCLQSPFTAYLEASNFCASQVREECKVTWSTQAHKPKFPANPGNPWREHKILCFHKGRIHQLPNHLYKPPRQLHSLTKLFNIPCSLCSWRDRFGLFSIKGNWLCKFIYLFRY